MLLRGKFVYERWFVHLLFSIIKLPSLKRSTYFKLFLDYAYLHISSLLFLFTKCIAYSMPYISPPPLLVSSFNHKIKTSQKTKKENLRLCWRTESNIEGTLSVSFFFFLLSIYLNTWRFSDNFKSQEDFETSLSWCFLLLIILLFLPLLTSPPLHSCSLEYFFVLLPPLLIFFFCYTVTFASYSYFRFLLRVSFVYLLLSSSPFFLFC